jgi:Ca2+-binding RTX toxin-like protein
MNFDHEQVIYNLFDKNYFLPLLLSGIELAEAELKQFADEPEFFAKMQIAFGSNINDSQLIDLQADWSVGDFSFIPQIKILSGAEIGVAKAAFSVETGTIYLSQDFLEQAGQDPKALARVLIEEIGHSVDQYLNNLDSPGDEGAIFLALVSGQGLTEEQLQQLYQEDDHGSIRINGQVVAAEFQNFVGDAGNNSITGTTGDDLIQGLAGNDFLDGLAGNDFINGGAGADVIDGGNGIDTADYSDSPAEVVVDLGTGKVDGAYQVIYQNSFYSLGTVSDTITANIPNPRGPEVIVTGRDQPTNIENLIGSRFNDSLTGNSQDNVINPGLTANGAVKNLQYGFNFDLVDGGAGKDLLVIDYSSINLPVRLEGYAGSYEFPGIGGVRSSNMEYVQLTATNGNDFVEGFIGGDDTINGLGGDDILTGGSAYFVTGNPTNFGNDVVNGGDGNDEIANRNYSYSGSDSNLLDRFDGGAGFDTLSADFSNQTADVNFIDGQSNDIIFADGTYAKNFEAIRNFTTGSGNDNLTLIGRLPLAFNSAYTRQINTGAGNDTITANGGLGNVKIDAGSGNDILVLDYSVDDSVTTGGVSGLVQDKSGVTSYGSYRRNDANNTFLDDLFADNIERYQVTGTSKADTLIGWTGDDIFKGLGGNDTISGGSGSDQFIFASGRPFSSADLGIDTITDFEFGKDKLVLDPLTFTAGTTFADVASDADVETNSAFIVYSKATGNLFYDQNGSDIGLGSGGQFAILSNKAALSANDFGILPKTNNPPTISAINKSGDEDTPLPFTANDFSNAFTDPDADPLTKIQIASLPANGLLNFNGTAVTQGQEINTTDLSSLNFTPSPDFNGSISFNWTGFDGKIYAATPAQVNLTINAINDAPILSAAITDQTATLNSAFSFTIPSNTFQDIDIGDTLTYSAILENGSVLPAWLTFNPSTQTFSGIPSNGDLGEATVKVTGTDGSGASVSDIFKLTVNDLGNPTIPKPKHDFNGDGKDDVVVRNYATGENAIAILDGTTVNRFEFSTPVPDLNWTIDGAGDFNGDGKPDVVLRNGATGENAIALMNGTSLDQVVFTQPVTDLNWVIGGVGDFNSDGKSDVLLRNKSTGENAFALMDGTNVSQIVFTPFLSDPTWTIGGVGDFSGDGKPDVLLRNNATGENAFALMDGINVIEVVQAQPVPDLNWTIGSVGDYNNDGQADILWRNQLSGENTFTLMNRTTLSQIVPTSTVTDLNWQIGA